MKPVAFDYFRPRTLREAAAVLGQAQGAGKLIAGGQSLGPMLNLRLAQPKLLIDIACLPELAAVIQESDELRIGACVTAANIEDGKAPCDYAPMLPRIAGGIAYRAVRNRATIGGSLCHADPAADWVTAMAALGGGCEAAKADGATRRISMPEFMTSAFENALAPDEALQAVILPRFSSGARFGFSKICRKTGKFALAIAAVLHDPERNLFRAAIGATSGKPIVIEEAEVLFGGAPRQGKMRFDQAMIGELLAAKGMQSATARQLGVAALRRAGGEVFADG